jgi:hypothetical protein
MGLRKIGRICNFVQVQRISNQQSPIANLDHPFAFSNIAGAKGVTDCRLGLLNANC